MCVLVMLIIYQIYFDALGKKGALGFMAVNAIVQFFMGLSIVSCTILPSYSIIPHLTLSQ